MFERFTGKSADKKPAKVPTDFRERLGYMIVALVVMVFAMIYTKPELSANDGFMLLAQAIVISALIGGVVAWGYSQGKGSDEDRGVMREQAKALSKASDPAWAPQQQPTPDLAAPTETTIYAESATVIHEDDPKADNGR